MEPGGRATVNVVRTWWLGWCLALGLAGTPARAEPPVVAKIDAKKGDARKADPKSDAKAEQKRKTDELLALTADPRLGKADRISGEELRGMVAFTFDDGPNPETTPAVIDALEKYDVPATFFIVTRRLIGPAGAKSRELLARQIAGGFLVESHSMTHANLRRATPATLTREVDESIRVLAKEANRPIGMFRAPFGAIDAAGRGWLKRRGLTEAFWSIDTLDWKARDAAKLRAKVMRMILAQHGGVVLMHDVKTITATVVPEILDDLEAENCRRLADGKQEPIVPVSIHYFLRDNRKPRAIPEDVKKRTEAYLAALPARCAARPKPEPPKTDATPAR
jgi:peptidoglycan-N-acetylglucosamine deacetylase